MPIEFNLSVDWKPVDDFVNKAQSAFRDFSLPLEICATAVQRSVDLNFANEGRPDKWTPLRPGTIEARKGDGKSDKILQDTGKLKQSWQRGAEGNIFQLSPVMVDIGTNIEYAHFHQDGTKGPYRIAAKNAKALWWKGLAHPVRSVNHPGLPARPFAMVQAEDETEFGNIFMKWVEDVT